MAKNKKDTKKSYERLIKAGLVDGGKIKGKFALGGDQSNDLQMQTARAIPIWGKLAQLNIQGGRAIRGDGTNTAANIAGGFADEPSRVFNAIKSGNLVEAVPIVGDIATTKRKRKELDNANNLQQTGIKSSLIQNSGGLAKGGNLNSIPKKLKVIQGGSLNPISKDAVEVNANNPSQTDSVELQDAFVDNNEVIDKKNRVFSDEILGSSGRSIAKEAKRLEKMKSTSSRFKDSNDRIESQLDNLFNQQEQMKQDKTRVSKPIRNDNPIDTLQEEVVADKKLNTAIPKLGAKQNSFSERMAKLGYGKGGKMGYDKGGPYSGMLPLQQPQEDGFAGINQPQAGNSFNWGSAANSAATVAPNVTNAFLQKRLKGPKAPQLETDLRLQRVDPSAQLAETARQANMINSSISKNTSQGSNLSSSLGLVLAKRLATNNQIYGQNQQINAQIQGNEAQINQASRARNASRINEFRGNQVDFANKKVQLTSENVANLSAKIQSNRREKNLMNLDKDKFNIIQSRFEDLPAELKAKYPTVFDYYNSPEYKKDNAFGGYLGRKSKKPNRSIGGK